MYPDSCYQTQILCTYIIINKKISLTPAAGSDYVDSNPQVVFTSGMTSNGDSECFNIVIINDDDYEENQNFQVEIDMISPSVASGTGSTVPVTIQDNNGILCS